MRGKTFAQRKVHVFEIAAGTVNKNDRRRIGPFAELDDMLTQPADLYEMPTWRMRPPDQPRADQGDQRADNEDGDESEHGYRSPK